jgi:hypothetical protein
MSKLHGFMVCNTLWWPGFYVGFILYFVRAYVLKFKTSTDNRAICESYTPYAEENKSAVGKSSHELSTAWSVRKAQNLQEEFLPLSVGSGCKM